MNFKSAIFIFTILTVVSAAVKKSYNGYTLYRVVPKDDGDVKILEDVKAKNLGEFWEEGFKVSHEVKVMVSPDNREEFVRYMANAKIGVKVVINDIQR